ncbi:GrpE-domain-containing protein [Parathielavia appendiculata]|uniref:GrpE protein homolog n=1 Tax=Parathielavia appendiculata TaxID=2587402 RepID=A0AAN6U074_9PEZI|nr:GrpE-domain-containing protein [Parathielavia appendiculata]
MLRQTISATSRALRSTARLSTQRQTASLPHFYQTPFAAVRTITPRTRWYSSETDAARNNGDAKDNGEEAKKEGEAESPEAALKKQLEAKDAEIRELKDKYLRSMAEQQNEFRSLQERTAREIQKNKEFAIQGFAQDLVDTVDNFDRALAMVPEEKLKSQSGEEKSEHQQDLVNLYEGLKMTETILMQTLKKHGLERFDPNGEVFNPHEHDATFMTPMPDKEHNTVFHVQQKGFRLNGRILRPAKVGVVKNK